MTRLLGIDVGTSSIKVLVFDTGCRVRVPNISETVALGAALLAGLGAGVFDNLADAVESVPDSGMIYEPGLQAKDLYDERYQYCREVYRRLSAAGMEGSS